MKMKFLRLFEKSSDDLVLHNLTSPPNIAVIVKIKSNAPSKWQDDVTKVLSRLQGVHRFELDVEQGRIKIMGNLTPEYLMKVLSKSTKYAEISKAYVTKEGDHAEDIFWVEAECNCKCPPCASRCFNPDHKCFQTAGHGYFNEVEGGYPPHQVPYYCGGGYSYGTNYYQPYNNNPLPYYSNYPSSQPPPGISYYSEPSYYPSSQPHALPYYSDQRDYYNHHGWEDEPGCTIM